VRNCTRRRCTQRERLKSKLAARKVRARITAIGHHELQAPKNLHKQKDRSTEHCKEADRCQTIGTGTSDSISNSGGESHKA
jgi:hypothetical protein